MSFISTMQTSFLLIMLKKKKKERNRTTKLISFSTKCRDNIKKKNKAKQTLIKSNLKVDNQRVYCISK